MPTPHIHGSHCSYCGAKFTEQTIWPRKCFICWNESYKNPAPVVVAIVPVLERDSTIPPYRWLVIQRNIEPQKGGWAFPGGYVEFGETYQEACVRELREEAGVETKPEDFNVQDIRNDDCDNMLIFCAHSGVFRDEIHFTSNAEVSAIEFPVHPEDKELCFPSHNEIWRAAYNWQYI